jgi:hypothetical protein
MFLTEDKAEFDFLSFYENFIIILRSLKNSDELAQFGYTFFRLSREI